MAGRTETFTVTFDRGGAKALERLSRAIEQSNLLELEKIRDRRAKDEVAVPIGCDEHCPVHEAKDVDSSYTVIGPKCFTDGKVISYKGENYYKTCDAYVYDHEGGGQSFCVLRLGHPNKYHEAYDGHLKAIE